MTKLGERRWLWTDLRVDLEWTPPPPLSGQLVCKRGTPMNSPENTHFSSLWEILINHIQVDSSLPTLLLAWDVGQTEHGQTDIYEILRLASIFVRQLSISWSLVFTFPFSISDGIWKSHLLLCIFQLFLCRLVFVTMRVLQRVTLEALLIVPTLCQI